MTLLLHLGHRRPSGHPGSIDRAEPAGAAPGHVDRVFAVQRAGAVTVGLILLTFGLVGFTRGVPLLSTQGERVLGMSANGLLATLSVTVAAILIGAAVRGPRVASTVMVALGALFLLSALVNLFVLGTSANIFAFEASNVAFSVVVGLLLLLLGAYGRFSGNLPASSPYAHPHLEVDEPPEPATTPEEVTAEAAMREAELAVVEHRATEDQRRRVQSMAQARTRYDRRRVWMTYERSSPPDTRGVG
jgi:hypothetical protein